MSNKQRLVLSIIDFLNQSIQDGTVKQDDKESLEVAIQCIGEAFGVDPNDQAQVERLSVKPANLLSIFDVFLKTKDKLGSTPGAAAAASASIPTSAPSGPSAADKEAAEKLKATGNAHMSAKKYDDAIEAYTKAIGLDPTNAVYYSNRAAAYSSKGEHSSAVLDAEKAIEVDPSFVKAYHRLGCVIIGNSSVARVAEPRLSHQTRALLAR
ncbi:TPR-like protein [Trametes cingulata]|nr:TPR-like protein [Trametes cingulata]